ncbi:sulfotransferase family 2 domain-containing protein [Methylocystis sp. JAN1]|uniref:sulfotransferase family 2 domain-containing protein n=1 Tax=Methylocystis sp. JAN1 TaxID=3397211 RepID=UPI003FA2126D
MSGFRMVLAGIENVPIVHCHIPRTGGMSVDYYFRNVFGDESCMRLGTGEDFIRIRNPDDPFYAFRWKYLSAHLPAREIMNLMGERKFFMFTIIRDPVEREISSFKNIVEHSYAEHSRDIRTFDDYLDMKEREGESNLQAHFLQVARQPARSVSAVLLQYISAGHAIMTVAKNYVLQEYIRVTLGSPHVIEPHNVSVSRFNLTSKQRRRLERFIEQDLELYELVYEAERTGDLLNDWRISWRATGPSPHTPAPGAPPESPAAAQSYAPGPHP